MSTALQLDTGRHQARSLMAWLAGRDGGLARAGVAGGADVRTARPQASVDSAGLSASDLAALLSAGQLSSAGVPVTSDTAMRVATVYACVDLICSAIKSLPFEIFERQKGGGELQIEHDYHWLFNERASEDWSAADAWAALLAGKFFTGIGYAELLRPSFGSSRIIGWQPLHPLACQPFRDAATQRKYYRVTRSTGVQQILHQADVIQITSPGFDGLHAPSPITYAAMEAVGTALAAQRWSAGFFRDGATFDYALSTDNKVDKDQREAIVATLAGRSAGSRLPLVLANGLKPVSLSFNPKDAEILATRIFSVEEICRIFRVPPFLVGHTEKSTSWGTGMEQQGSSFVRYTLAGHLAQIRQEFNHKLWPVRARYAVRHITDALERGDLKGRFEAYRIGLGRAGEQPWLSIDEIRRIENMGPMPATSTPTEGAQDAP